MDRSAAVDKAKKYADKVRREFIPDAIVMFGSCANATSNDQSDIDIAVIFDAFHGQRLETAARLWRLSYGIDDRIEPHLLDKSEDRVGFVREVLRTGVAL